MASLRLLLFLVLVPAVSAGALDIFLNGNVRNSFNSCEYSQNGISLLESAPLMSYVRQVSVGYGNGKTAVISGAEAERFYRWRLLPGETGLNLISEDTTWYDVSSIKISGEELETGELTVWLSWEGAETLETVIRRFADAHNLVIDVQLVPSVLSKVSSVARGRGRIPDVFMVQADYIPELVDSRLIQGLDDMDNTRLQEKGLAAFSRDGALWARPLYCDTQLVFYNPSLVSDIPFDWDLDDFEHLLENLADQGVSPVSWNAYSAYWLISFQIGFGKENFLEPDGSLVVNDNSSRDALGYLIDLQDRGLLDIREREGMMSRFITGDTGMILSGSYSIPSFIRSGVDFIAVPYPYNRRTGKYISPLLDFKGLAVSRRTYYPVLARRLVEYLTDPVIQYRFTSEVFKIPADSAAFGMIRENPALPHMKALLDSYSIGTVIPPNDAYPVYKNTMWKLLSLAFTGRMAVDDLLEQGQVIINEKMDRSYLR